MLALYNMRHRRMSKLLCVKRIVDISGVLRDLEYMVQFVISTGTRFHISPEPPPPPFFFRLVLRTGRCRRLLLFISTNSSLMLFGLLQGVAAIA